MQALSFYSNNHTSLSPLCHMGQSQTRRRRTEKPLMHSGERFQLLVINGRGILKTCAKDNNSCSVQARVSPVHLRYMNMYACLSSSSRNSPKCHPCFTSDGAGQAPRRAILLVFPVGVERACKPRWIEAFLCLSLPLSLYLFDCIIYKCMRPCVENYLDATIDRRDSPLSSPGRRLMNSTRSDGAKLSRPPWCTSRCLPIAITINLNHNKCCTLDALDARRGHLNVSRV